MAAPPELTGLVLAGGASRRLGRDKSRLRLRGVPLIEHVSRRLDVICDHVLIASGDGARFAEVGRREVADDPAGVGPLGGLIAGLEAATTPAVAVVAVDLPYVDPGILVRLADRLGGRLVAAPVAVERVQPLHAVWSTDAAGPLRRLVEDGEFMVTRAFQSLDGLTVDVEDLDPVGRFAENVNTPDDVLRLGLDESGGEGRADPRDRSLQ